jgi:hypothetical protein
MKMKREFCCDSKNEHISSLLTSVNNYVTVYGT